MPATGDLPHARVRVWLCGDHRRGRASSSVVSLGARGDEPVKPTASASEANPAVPAPGHSVHGEAFNDGPRHAAYLMPGMGKVHFPVTTTKPEAQAFIDQGVAQLHSFYYFEAERSFRQAAKIDPGLRHGLLGHGDVERQQPQAGQGVPQGSPEAGRAASVRREPLYLDALEALLQGRRQRQGPAAELASGARDDRPGVPRRHRRPRLAGDGHLAERDGRDRQPAGGRHRARHGAQVEPMHPGAHHYRIHLWDGVKPIRAEKSAALYAKTAPGIAHAWHMPGHTYTGLKRYADAAYQQEGSARVDHAYMIRDRVMPFEIHNYAHNNQWLCTSLSHIGRVRDAIAVARNLVEQPRDPQKNGPNDGGSPQRSGRIRWAEILTRYELWDDLIAATTSGALDWSNVPLEQRAEGVHAGPGVCRQERPGQARRADRGACES